MGGKLKIVGKVRKIAYRMLRDVCRILDENEITYNVDNGTLLGIIRENRLIPWDNDVDVSIHVDNLDKLLKIRYKFWLAGYRTRIRKAKIGLPHFPKGTVRMIKIQARWLIFKRFSLLDIYPKRESKGYYYWTEGIKKPVLKRAPSHFYENLVRHDFEGYSYLIPQDYEDYLAYRYGDWRIPVKVFDFHKDDKAIIFQKNE